MGEVGGGATQALEKSKSTLAELQSRLSPLKSERAQLTRQFWVSKDQLKANKYDLSASRYRQLDQDPTYTEDPSNSLDRLSEIERKIDEEIILLRQKIEHK